MDSVVKWGVIFGLLAAVVSLGMGAALGCCNFAVSFGLGLACGAVAARAVRSEGTLAVGGGVEVLVPTAPRNPIKEGAKAAALASLFMAVGGAVGRIAGAAFSRNYVNKLLLEWGWLTEENLADPAHRWGQWIGTLGGAACCGVVDILFMIAGGAMGAWLITRR